MFRTLGQFAILAVFTLSSLPHVYAQQSRKPSATQALALRPVQTDVDFDMPDAESAKAAKITARKLEGKVGWYVTTESGQMLRRFLDTNSDNRVDQWCYYKNGIEVYRDIDADFNGKADQYRWLGLAGIRWGEDEDEDGRIDSWKLISAEEVTEEAVAAIRERDSKRFALLLLTNVELRRLNLPEDREKELSEKLTQARDGFAALVRSQTVINKDTTWLHFGGRRPGVVPTDGSGSSELIVYENVAAVVESKGRHAQVSIGSLVKVGDVWRLIDLPGNLQSGQDNLATAGFFFQAPAVQQPHEQTASTAGLSEKLQELVADLEKIDDQLAAATQGQLSSLNERRANVLEQLAEASADAEQKVNWLRQLADTVNAAVQSGDYPAGIQRLKKLADDLADDPDSRELAPYVEFRYMTADYTTSLQAPEADYGRIQEKWLADLQRFIAAHPRIPDAADAMLQLAIAYEFAGETEDAIKWFDRIGRDFPNAELAKKATGASRRLQSIGKSIDLRGVTLSGKTINLSSYRGHTVLIQYWATWCEPCKNDMTELKRILAKYSSKRFSIIGVNLDSERSTAVNFLRTNRLPWHQLYEDGGLDSRFANELGILTLPTMVLVDAQGKVVRRNIHIGGLDAELDKLAR